MIAIDARRRKIPDPLKTGHQCRDVVGVVVEHRVATAIRRHGGQQVDNRYEATVVR